MKIIHLYDTTNPRYEFFKDIESSLKKHTVEVVDDRNFNTEELVKKCEDADLLLFHHGGIYTDNQLNYSLSLERLKQILQAVKCKKVCWFFDKVWFLNNTTMEDIIPLTDHVFLNDGTWVKRHKYPNVYTLRSGTPKYIEGKERKEYKCLISFYGDTKQSIWRKPYLENLKNRFGKNFKVFDNLFGQDLADLIKSSKFVFVPVQPNDEFYWDNRIYQILSQGGVPIYPRLYGLKEEGFISGKHYLGYKRPDEIPELIKQYADKVDEIAKEGQEFVKKFTYANRIKEILKKI